MAYVFSPPVGGEGREAGDRPPRDARGGPGAPGQRAGKGPSEEAQGQTGQYTAINYKHISNWRTGAP